MVSWESRYKMKTQSGSHEGRDTRVSQTRSERQTRSFVRRRFAVYGIFNSSTVRSQFVSGKPLCPALHDITMRVSSKKSVTLLKTSQDPSEVDTTTFSHPPPPLSLSPNKLISTMDGMMKSMLSLNQQKLKKKRIENAVQKKTKKHNLYRSVWLLLCETG